MADNSAILVRIRRGIKAIREHAFNPLQQYRATIKLTI
jgi:hypothetical protein